MEKKIFFFKGTRHDCKEDYNKLEVIENKPIGKNGGYVKLKKSNTQLVFDSKLEKRILLDLDKCKYISKIKTQSLLIMFKGKSKYKLRKYIPDFQLLLVDGSLVIIEVKPFKEMVNSTVLKKGESLRKFCKEKKYGHAIIDRDKNGNYYSFEDLKNEKVPMDIQKKFIDFVAERKEVTFSECKLFRDKYNINEKQICYIIWRHKYDLKYQQHKIIFKKKKK